jgi:bla regulator protein blaR1
MSAAHALSAAAPRLLATALAEVGLSAVVAAVVWIACLPLRHRWPALQQALWVLVFLRLVLPPSLAHPLSAGALLDHAGLGFGRLWGGAAASEGFRDSSAGDPRASDAESGLGPEARAGSDVMALMALWAAVVIALLARDWRRGRAYRRLLASGLPVRGGIASRLERWRRRLGIRRAVRLVAADAQVSPFTLGTLHPVIFVPRALLERRNRRALAAAVGHELAHVARWDVLWMRLERWLVRLYFFHPALWVASRRLDACRERMCDALPVTHGLVAAPHYVEGLLRMLQLDLEGVEAPSLTLGQRRILMRLQSVLAVRPSRRSRPVLAALLAAFVGCFLLPLAGADVTTPADPVQGTLAEAAQPAAASLGNPLPSGRVTRPYGEGVGPFGPEVEFHHGIDIGAEVGTPIIAAADGIVELATTSYAPLESAGTVVVIDHQDGRKTFYGHLGELKVKAGQRVSRGETIALVGKTGRSTGPHLHFELWESGRAVDPAGAVPAWGRHAQ